MTLLVRDAVEADFATVTGIYRHHVQHGLATFEESPPDEAEMIRRWRVTTEGGYPYIVAEREGEVVGYAYAGQYRPRPAYRYTVENSVYVRDGKGGHGIGSTLLGELIARCEAGPWRQMIAVIGNSGNTGSIALHRKFGFEHVGTLRAVGFKLDQWVDTVLMQRSLGE